MARAGIVYSHVADAAARLAAAGKNPTVDGVREALGGTGSKSTIAPLLKRWKGEHQESVAASETGIPGELLQALKGVHDKLQAGVDQQLEQARQTHRMALQQAVDHVQQCVDDNLALSNANAELSGQLAQTRQALERLREEHQARSVTLATLHSENDGLRQRLADHAAQLAALNEQMTQARAQFEHYQQASAAQRADERQAGEQRCARLELELAGARQQAQDQRAAIIEHGAHLSQLRAAHLRLQDEAAAVREQLALACAERDRLRPQCDQLAARCQEMSAAHQVCADKLEAAQQTLTTSRIALAGQEKHSELLSGLLERSNGRVQELERERLALLQEQSVLRALVAPPGAAEAIGAIGAIGASPT